MKTNLGNLAVRVLGVVGYAGLCVQHEISKRQQFLKPGPHGPGAGTSCSWCALPSPQAAGASAAPRLSCFPRNMVTRGDGEMGKFGEMGRGVAWDCLGWRGQRLRQNVLKVGPSCGETVSSCHPVPGLAALRLQASSFIQPCSPESHGR